MMSMICFSQNWRYVSAVSYLSRSSLTFCILFRIDMAEGAKVASFEGLSRCWRRQRETWNVWRRNASTWRRCDVLSLSESIFSCPCLRVSSLLLSRLGGKQRTVTLPVRLSLRIIGNTIGWVSQKHSNLQDDARHVTSFWGQITVFGRSPPTFLHFWLVKSENKSIKGSSTH